MNTCKTCKWWDRKEDVTSAGLGIEVAAQTGACKMVNLPTGPWSSARCDIEVETVCKAKLMTGPDFGCVHHAEKPETRPLSRLEKVWKEGMAGTDIVTEDGLAVLEATPNAPHEVRQGIVKHIVALHNLAVRGDDALTIRGAAEIVRTRPIEFLVILSGGRWTTSTVPVPVKVGEERDALVEWATTNLGADPVYANAVMFELYHIPEEET